jgi:hypothetical protein
MALSILDGNQSATTLSTILSSGQHITAHTVVSLGTQAITDIVNATSAGLTNTQLRASAVTIGGTVTANLYGAFLNTSGGYQPVQFSTGLPVANEKDGMTFNPIPFLVEGSVTIGSAIPTGTNRIGVVTIGGGTVTIGAGTAQIGSVTAFLTYSQTAVSLSSTAATAIPIVFPTNGVYGGSLQGYNGTNTYIYSGIQAIGNNSLASATSLPVSLGSLPALVASTAQIGSVTASISNSVTIASLPSISGTVTVGNTVTIAGTVTANLASVVTTDTYWGTQAVKVTGGNGYGIDIAGIDNAGSPALFSEGGGIPVYPRSDFAEGVSFPVSGTVTVGNSVTIGSLPAISGTVTANIFAVQGTAVTTSNFTSTTASTVLANFNATREVLTIFNEGAGNLHICAGATCTTIAYQVRLSSGDYYEVPNHQTTITHSAVFATAGTARIVQIS